MINQGFGLIQIKGYSHRPRVNSLFNTRRSRVIHSNTLDNQGLLRVKSRVNIT